MIDRLQTTIATIALAMVFVPSISVADGEEQLTERDKLLWAAVGGEIKQFNGAADEAGLDENWGQIVVYTAAPELGFTAQVPAYRYIGETARTDKQVGSSSTSRGTTSLLEKPGIPALIAWAVERGAIEQEETDTNFTLRSSPASLYRIAYRSQDGGSAEDEPVYAWLNRIGASVTLPIDESGDDGDLSEVTEWSIQLNLNFWGDRTVHSQSFYNLWAERVVPAIEGRLSKVSKAVRETLDDWPDLRARKQLALTAARNAVRQLLNENQATYRGAPQFVDVDEVRTYPGSQRLFDAASQVLEVEIAQPIRVGTMRPPPAVVEKLAVDLPAITAAHVDLAEVKRQVDEHFDDLLAVPVFTAEYTNHNAEMGSNFSEAKLLLQHRVDLTSLIILPEPFDLIWNANVSLYHDPDGSMDQETVRDFGAGVGAEFRFDNPFAGLLADADLSYITFLLAGRVARQESADAVAGFAQAKLEIPLAAGLNLPLSVTYATRTEDNAEDEVRGNLGFSFDFDKLYALAALVRMQ